MDVPQGNPLTTDNYSMRRHGSIRKDVREDMKNMKKILALVVAVLMIVASMSVAFAAGHTITVPTTDTHEYKVYQILTGKLNDAKDTLTNAQWGSSAKTATEGKINGNTVVYYPWEKNEKGYIFTWQNEVVILPLEGRKFGKLSIPTDGYQVDYARDQVIIRLEPGVVYTFESVDEHNSISGLFCTNTATVENVEYANG